jgi:aminoglycoside phosphotransferase family enzyme
MTIVEALEELRVDGLTTGHDHIIETVLSKLFFRGNEVQKAYKHRTADFANLADKDTRREWITEDFHWNNIMAPEIYLELRHVTRKNDRFMHTSPSLAEDWYIVMRRFEHGRDLLSALEKDTITHEDLSMYTRLLTERLRTLTERKKDGLAYYTAKGNTHLKDEVLGVCDWAYTAVPHLTNEDVDRAKKVLSHIFEREEYFTRPMNLSVVIDTNPDNIILLDNGISFIDVMPPKDSWRVHDRYFALCRTSADISALLGEKRANVLHDTYSTLETLPPEIVRKTYELASGLIQVPYRKMIGRDDLASAYTKFVKKRIEELERFYA